MNKRIGRFFSISVHVLEYVVAAISLAVIVILVGYEIFKMVSIAGYFDNPDTYIQSVLTVLVGLEFVRMLINLTPANILEVLIVAIARQIIATHDAGLGSFLAVACIAGLFAIRKFLVPKRELSHEMATVKIEKDAKDEKEDKEDKEEEK
jgi:hypothetical protein